MSKTALIFLGSDPELFLEDTKGKVISAIGKIGGTKDKPRPCPELGKGYAIQEDNVLLEYNTPPAKGPAQWLDYQTTMRDYLREVVGQLGLVLSTKASHSMDDDQLDHPTAWVFGCDPDYSVWDMKWNKKPQSPDPKLRSAGGHIHVCYENPNMADSIRLGRIMDYFIGAPLAMKDPDRKRQELYGKPGAIRFKPYGLEYRTPSNFWTLNSQTIDAVFVNTNLCVQLLDSFDSYRPFFESARDYLMDREKGYYQENLFYSHAMPYDACLTMAELSKQDSFLDELEQEEEDE